VSLHEETNCRSNTQPKKIAMVDLQASSKIYKPIHAGVNVMASRAVLSTRYRVWVISFVFLVLLIPYIWLFAWENFWDLSLYQIFFWVSGITFVMMAANWFHLYYLYGFRLVGWGFVRFFWICYSRLIVSILLTSLFVAPLSVNAILVSIFFLFTSFVSYILIYQETKRAFYLEEFERKERLKRRRQELEEEEKRLNIWSEQQTDRYDHLLQRQKDIVRQEKEISNREEKLENKTQLLGGVPSLNRYGLHPYFVYSRLSLEELEILSKQCSEENGALNCKAILYLACSMMLEEVSHLLKVPQEILRELLHNYNEIGHSVLSTFVLLESDSKDFSCLQVLQEPHLNIESVSKLQAQSGNNISLNTRNLSDTTGTPGQIYIPPDNLYQ